MGNVTCMGIRHWDLPNTDVAKHAGHKLAESQRYDQFKVVAPIYIHVFPDAPQVEKRSAQNGDREQLDHCHGQRVGKLVQDGFPDNIIGWADRVPG